MALHNLARMTTATVGAGTITLGSAVSGFLTFALAGVANLETVPYGISDGANSEVGTGTYTSAGTTLSRTVTASTNGNAAISLSGNAQVYITARAEDIAGFFSSSTVLLGAAVSVTTATPKDITSLSLPAGDYDLFGNVVSAPAGTTTSTVIGGWISTASNSFPTRPNAGAQAFVPAISGAGQLTVTPVGFTRMSLSSTTTVFLTGYAEFAVSTMGMYGFLGARQVG